LVAADGQIAWTGGRNITEQGFYRQHDLSLTVTGPLVKDYEERFERSWEVQGGQTLPVLKSRAVPHPNALAHVIGTDPPRLELQKALYQALDAARHHVYLENFSLSDPGILHRLAQARHRGADVRVVLTVESTSDAVNHANRVTVNQLLQAGVRVYLYPGMTHVKAMSVDGCWAYTGTGNFDPLSLRRNHEIGLAITEGSVIAELEERLFFSDFGPEWELTEPLPVTVIDHIYQWVAKLAL
jgi:cardiolipin synthase